MKLDADAVNKINKLAATLRNTGLASSTQEAVEKAKEIVLGKDYSVPTIEEISEDVNEVEEDLKEDLGRKGIYFADGSDPEDAPELEDEFPDDPEVKEELARLKAIIDEPVETKAKDLDEVEEKELPVEDDMHEEPGDIELPSEEKHQMTDEQEDMFTDHNKGGDVAEEFAADVVDLGSLDDVEGDRKDLKIGILDNEDSAQELDDEDPDYDVTKEDKTVKELFAKGHKREKNDEDRSA
jgi:hypothetical protein